MNPPCTVLALFLDGRLTFDGGSNREKDLDCMEDGRVARTCEELLIEHCKYGCKGLIKGAQSAVDNKILSFSLVSVDGEMIV